MRVKRDLHGPRDNHLARYDPEQCVSVPTPLSPGLQRRLHVVPMPFGDPAHYRLVRTALEQIRDGLVKSADGVIVSFRKAIAILTP